MASGLCSSTLGCLGVKWNLRYCLPLNPPSTSPVSRPPQAKELGSQFLVLRTGAGLLCLQLRAFYGTGNVV